MCSNDKVVVYVDEGDRRFVVFETSEKYRNDQKWFAEYEKYIQKPENQRAIYDFLLARDISEVDWVNDRPKTKAYLTMKNSSLSPTLKWFVEFIDNYPFESEILTGGLVTRPNVYEWKCDELIKHYPGQNDKDTRLVMGRDIAEMIADYEVPEECLKKRKKNGYIFYRIDQAQCEEWLKKKDFLLE